MNMSPQEPIRILNKDDKPAHRVKFVRDGNLYILDITMTADTYNFLYLEGIDVPVFVGRNANCAC